MRSEADALLETQSVSAATVDDWESLAHEYGALQLSMPLHTFLLHATSDLARVRTVLAQRQPLEFQRRLYRVMAQLAGLIATGVNMLGDLRETRAWFHSSRLAAEETGDRRLRAWVVAYEGMSYLYYGRPVTRAVELAQTAQALAGASPSAEGALAASIEARAHARLGHRRESLAAINRSEAMFERLQETDPNVLGFYEQLLRFYQSNVFTFIGETRRAMVAQRRALELLPPGDDLVDPVLVLLDQATCLIHEGELTEGCRLTTQTLLAVPPQTRLGAPAARAKEIATLIGSRSPRLTTELNEVLQLSHS